MWPKTVTEITFTIKTVTKELFLLNQFFLWLRYRNDFNDGLSYKFARYNNPNLILLCNIIMPLIHLQEYLLKLYYSLRIISYNLAKIRWVKLVSVCRDRERDGSAWETSLRYLQRSCLYHRLGTARHGMAPHRGTALCANTRILFRCWRDDEEEEKEKCLASS